MATDLLPRQQNQTADPLRTPPRLKRTTLWRVEPAARQQRLQTQSTSCRCRCGDGLVLIMTPMTLVYRPNAARSRQRRRTAVGRDAVETVQGEAGPPPRARRKGVKEMDKGQKSIGGINIQSRRARRTNRRVLRARRAETRRRIDSFGSGVPRP